LAFPATFASLGNHKVEPDDVPNGRRVESQFGFTVGTKCPNDSASYLIFPQVGQPTRYGVRPKDPWRFPICVGRHSFGSIEQPSPF
ncbi:MAG: hypothetical protein KDA87_00535, partial [Planctomycetales bacterium]|nr:hypothetical protein [Planctomycetales bacterium]